MNGPLTDSAPMLFTRVNNKGIESTFLCKAPRPSARVLTLRHAPTSRQFILQFYVLVVSTRTASRRPRYFCFWCLHVFFLLCVFMCVCCHPVYSGRQTCGRTSRGHTGGRSHRIPSAVLALIFIARRIQPSHAIVDCEVEFCVPTKKNVLHLLGIFIFIF